MERHANRNRKARPRANARTRGACSLIPAFPSTHRVAPADSPGVCSRKGRHSTPSPNRGRRPERIGRSEACKRCLTSAFIMGRLLRFVQPHPPRGPERRRRGDAGAGAGGAGWCHLQAGSATKNPGMPRHSPSRVLPGSGGPREADTACEAIAHECASASCEEPLRPLPGWGRNQHGEQPRTGTSRAFSRSHHGNRGKGRQMYALKSRGQGLPMSPSGLTFRDVCESWTSNFHLWEKVPTVAWW